MQNCGNIIYKTNFPLNISEIISVYNEAMQYYPKIGMEKVENGFIFTRKL